MKRGNCSRRAAHTGERARRTARGGGVEMSCKEGMGVLARWGRGGTTAPPSAPPQRAAGGRSLWPRRPRRPPDWQGLALHCGLAHRGQAQLGRFGGKVLYRRQTRFTPRGARTAQACYERRRKAWHGRAAAWPGRRRSGKARAARRQKASSVQPAGPPTNMMACSNPLVVATCGAAARELFHGRIVIR